MFHKDIVVIDFETEMTRGRFDVPFAVEIGAVRLNKNDLGYIGTYQSLILPPVAKEAMHQRTLSDAGNPLDSTLADILEEDLDHAPPWGTVMQALDEFCVGAQMAAWPITFERPVLDAAAKLYELEGHHHFPRRWLDIGSICYAVLAAWSVFTDKSDAVSIAEWLRVPVLTPKPHRGLPDALFEAELLRAAMAKMRHVNYEPPQVWERKDGTPTNEPWAGLAIPHNRDI